MSPTSPLSRHFLVMLAIALIGASSAPAAVDVVRDARQKDKPLPRLREMIDWVAVEQQHDGGWAYRMWLPIGFHIHKTVKPKELPRELTEKQGVLRDSFDTEVFDTAMCGLALMRAGSTTERGDYYKQVELAAEYLYRAVQSSDPGKVTTGAKPTPFTDRIGARADSFAALLFFVTLRDMMNADVALAQLRGAKVPKSFHYDGVIGTLLQKIQSTIGDDGSWPAGGGNAPMLSHALGVWALEAAARSGLDVDLDKLGRAERYAMSVDAEKIELLMNGRWKKSTAVARPDWMKSELLDDDEPIAAHNYLMSARLSILYQADLTNRVLVARERQKYAADARGAKDLQRAGNVEAAGTVGLSERSTRSKRTLTMAEYAKLNELNVAASRTKATLSAARDAIRKTWTKPHKNDQHPSPAPLLFTSEDYLASLLVVDAMAECRDVEQWFPPLVKHLMTRQDLDGGLRCQEPILCGMRGPNTNCKCAAAGPDILRTSREKMMQNLNRKHQDFALEPQFCPWQRSWAAKERTFITAAGTMMLLADTPYRAAFMGAK